MVDLEHVRVLQIDLSIDSLLERIVLILLGHIEVHRVIVGGEFVALEKLNGGLPELQHDDFME